ncbi:MAG: hypothetical protein HY556_03725 [Euryarchaeota archaeon]|nr:hypothetical protein [Euryarchaeota archaeon]
MREATIGKATIAIAVALMLSPVGAAIPLVSEPAWPWTTETVDTASVNGWTSIGLDSIGRPHVVYQTSTGIMYAVRGASSWSVENVVVSSFPSIAINSTDVPHMSFFKGGTFRDLMYAHRDPGGWIFEAVDTGGDVGGLNVLRLDAQDQPHILYEDNTNGNLKYATKDATGWHLENVTGSPPSPWKSFDIDSIGKPHVIWVSGENLHHATKNTTGDWTTEDIDTAAPWEVGLRVDSQSHLHASYSGTGEVLKYAHYNGTTWTTEIVDADSPTGGYTSIDVDSQDRPHIAYWQVFNRGNIDDPTRGHLKYAAKLADGTWHTGFVDPVGETGRYTSIALDANDKPRIAYHFANYQPNIGEATITFDLKYAEPAGASLLSSV